jgi:hypothetical protein
MSKKWFLYPCLVLVLLLSTVVTPLFQPAVAVAALGDAKVADLSANPLAYWTDGFEDYATGSFPSANWVADANASDSANNYVDGSEHYSGSRSLRLYGQEGGCWGALAHRTIEVSFPYYVEAMIRNGAEALGGCHPYYAVIQICDEPSWATPLISIVLFSGSGQILAENGMVLGDYLPGVWYAVKVKCELPTPSILRMSYWINDEYKGQQDFDATVVNLEGFKYLALQSAEGTAWFDDVRVWATPALMEGDVTGNGRVTISDALMIAQYKAGMITLTADQLLCADTTDDGMVSMADAMHIAQWLVDPTGSLGVLHKPVWQSPADDAMLPPQP